MSFTKKGTDYQSYSYLEGGRDYKLFDLADELNRVELYLIPLSDDEEKRVEQLVTDNLMVSLHDHIEVFPDDMSDAPSYTHEGRMTTAFKGL
ncbi:MAG: diguanylate cyclase, partial [Planctomycetes bacterium]|nr:diguanylate cyclase [Planctomycetota bacterium]